MPTPELEVVLRWGDPRARQAEADGWECIATSWGARLTLDPGDTAALIRLRHLVDRAVQDGDVLREVVSDDLPQVLELDALTANDYPGGVATRHDPLDEAAARALLEQGRLWGVWSGDALVALTATRVIGDRVEAEFTTVHPEHRRRGLATAVKAVSVLAHAERGANLFGTGGADSNLASLAMNEAVGYQITERWSTYRRRGAASDATSCTRLPRTQHDWAASGCTPTTRTSTLCSTSGPAV